MEDTTQTNMASSLKTAVDDILGVIEQDREREIISRRFGLNLPAKKAKYQVYTK